ncbi:cinnamoyl-CoA reductase 1-like [Quillaja saponaria]|uniref:Cinnamoyl-CoA reductase 1-like n=1 Tax=Quillaja saponaria TaxID=32244 RepID=A0AAD7L0A7_QUISA|nr:cinnamoyl-CoA reductase 1-like [Quillaja saponaria]
MSEAGKVVCVTGASGFIASWLVKLLLQRGYTVKATVRDPKDPKKVSHLLALEGAEERLHLFKANLVEEGCFDSVVEGCECVFHTASPVKFNATDPQAEVIDPALKGTLNVLRSCAKVPYIKRVIITSSMATIYFKGIPLLPDVTVDETWFSDPAFVDKSKPWYSYVVAKILAEEAAWKFAKENGFDMFTINPGLVMGPLLQSTLNLSVLPILNLINGSETFQNASQPWVDVRDVANAHILAMENPSASGRYCLVEKVIHMSEVVKILRELFPALKLPDKCEDDKPFEPICHVSKKRAESLGLKFTPLEVSLRDTVISLTERTEFETHGADW